MSKYSDVSPSEYERLDDELSDKIRSSQTISELKDFYEIASKMKNSNPEYSLSYMTLTIRATSILWGKAASIDSIKSFSEIAELLEFIQQLIQYSFTIERSRDVIISLILDRIDVEMNIEDVQENHEIVEIIKDMIKDFNPELLEYSMSIKEKLTTIKPYVPSGLFLQKESPTVRVVPKVDIDCVVKEKDQREGYFNNNFGVEIYFGTYKGDKVVFKIYKYTGILPEEKKKEIENEIRCLETLGTGLSPNIVNYRGSWIENNQINIMMDYYPKSLKQLIIEGGTRSVTNFTRLANQMINGFAVMQNNNIHHGDIKPENIMIDDQVNIRIIDFGYSVMRVEPSFSASSSSSIKEGLNITGTQGYIAPELLNLQGDGKSLPKYRRGKADVFSLGITFMKMLKGQDWKFSVDTLKNERKSLPIEFKGLISAMVKIEPKKRKSFKDLMKYFEVERTG